ncbi:MAG TPA: TadE/TadG family type IV pilus assembly protein [Micropepsaceae bacterium]|jgi:Flp pilus assembly protein TadG|nr:TadE/TadG family type IV pilus assembly protein [Micropepsaceae bacterium]
MATEFALIAPVLIASYFGVTELSDGYIAKSKVTTVTSTAADLTAQDTTVCDAEITDIFAALTAIMFPYPTNNMKITISSVIDAGSGNVKVAWSDAQNTTPRAVNSSVTLPAGLTLPAGGSVVLAEVSYDYSSPAGHMIYGKVQLSDQFFMHPRRTAQISRTSGC